MPNYFIIIVKEWLVDYQQSHLLLQVTNFCTWEVPWRWDLELYLLQGSIRILSFRMEWIELRSP